MCERSRKGSFLHLREDKGMNRIQISPSILSADFAAMGAAVEKLENAVRI